MKVLSLFDGMSCGRIALRELGITPETYYASEIDRHAIAQTQGLKVCKNGKTVFMNLEMLPTPRASKITGGDRADFTPSLPGLAIKGLLPTPRAFCYKDMKTDRGKSNLGEVIMSKYSTGKTSQLNPLFVAEMMGFPTSWTVLPFLPGGSSPSRDMETPSSPR